MCAPGVGLSGAGGFQDSGRLGGDGRESDSGWLQRDARDNGYVERALEEHYCGKKKKAKE